MITDEEITRARRHMGIPVQGIPNSRYGLGLRRYDPELPYYVEVGLFEYRIGNLTPVEESILTGRPISSIAILYASAGATITLTAVDTASKVSTTLCTYTVTPQDMAQPEPLYAISINVAELINQSVNAYIAVWGGHSPGTGAVPPQASVLVTSALSLPFTVVVTAVAVGAYVTKQGLMPLPERTFKDKPAAVTTNGLLPLCDYLEGRVYASADFAAFEQADVVKFDKGEMAKRRGLYNVARLSLSHFFGIKLMPLGDPNIGGGGAFK